MHQKYITFKRGPIQGVCIPELEPHLDFFTGAFDEWLAGQPMRVFLDRPNRVAGLNLPPTLLPAESPSGRPVVLKRFGWRSPLHRLVRSLTGSKAIRSFQIAMTLREAGVATPRPLIALDRKGGGTVPASYYITEEIPDATTLRQLLKSPTALGPERTERLTELANLVRRTHDAGVLHRDLTIGNFLVAPKPVAREGGRRIFLIDLSRAVRLGRVPLPLRLIDLARMKLNDLWPDFYAVYCAGRPGWRRFEPILRALVWIRRRRMDLWKKIKGR